MIQQFQYVGGKMLGFFKCAFQVNKVNTWFKVLHGAYALHRMSFLLKSPLGLTYQTVIRCVVIFTDPRLVIKQNFRHFPWLSSNHNAAGSNDSSQSGRFLA